MSKPKNRMFGFVTETWNPIVGCTHKCIYCLTSDTLVLMGNMTWKPISKVDVGDIVIGFDERTIKGYRKLFPSKVIAKAKHNRIVYEIITSRGSVKATRDHLWLVSRGRWRKTKAVSKWGYGIHFLWKPEKTPRESKGYKCGYIAGVLAGDGTFRLTPERMRHKKTSFLRIAMKDKEPLIRIERYLKDFGIHLPLKEWYDGLGKIETWSSVIVKKILEIAKLTPSNIGFKRGFLAGIFDAEGSLSRGILRITNYDEELKKRVQTYGRGFGFTFREEEKGIRLIGGQKEILRFFNLTNPAIIRKKLKLLSVMKHEIAEIETVEKIGRETVYDISTTSGTFIANGFASHNCWARRQAQRQKKDCPKCGWFTPHLHRERLNRKFKPNTLVFVCDMADLFGYGVDSSWIKKVLKVIKNNPETTFFLETKNPHRMQYYNIPDNVILSVTIETCNNSGELPKIGGWHYRMISSIPVGPIDRYYEFAIIERTSAFFSKYKTHVSIEPILDFDLNRFVEWILNINPEFGVSIGYDNYNWRLPEPPLAKTLQLIEELEKHGIKVERKTLRKAWWEE